MVYPIRSVEEYPHKCEKLQVFFDPEVMERKVFLVLGDNRWITPRNLVIWRGVKTRMARARDLHRQRVEVG
jgi:hypothetical protein